MAGKSSIVKKDAKTRKAIKQGLIDGVPVRTIATQTDTNWSSIQRYKGKVQKEIAEKASEDIQETYDLFKESIGTWEMMQKDYVSLFKMYYEKSMQGDKDAKKALKQLLAIGKELRPLTADIVKIIGDIREATEVNNRPALIVAQISQIIQTSDIKDREVLLDRIRIIADK